MPEVCPFWEAGFLFQWDDGRKARFGNTLLLGFYSQWLEMLWYELRRLVRRESGLWLVFWENCIPTMVMVGAVVEFRGRHNKHNIGNIGSLVQEHELALSSVPRALGVIPVTSRVSTIKKLLKESQQ